MAYLLLLLTLAIWAFLALRGQPLRDYTPIYFIGDSMAYAAQFLLSGVFRLYQYRSGWLPDPFRDERLMGTFVVLGIDPLIVLLYARYCRPHPYLTAAITSAGLSLTELLFVWTGAMVYPTGRWNPFFTLVLSFPAFLFIWRLTIRKVPIPAWWHVWAMAFWVTMPMDTLMSGALGLWRYRLGGIAADPRRLSRIVGFLYNAAVAGLMGVETAGVATRVIRYAHWSLWPALLNYTVTVFLPLLYTRWYQWRE